MLARSKLAGTVFVVFQAAKSWKSRMRADLLPRAGGEFQEPGPDSGFCRPRRGTIFGARVSRERLLRIYVRR